MSVGANIKAKRIELNLTQRELAHRVNVDPSMICQIERGTKMPTLPLGKEIARRPGLHHRRADCLACIHLQKE